MRIWRKIWGGLLGIWDTADGGSFVQVLGANVVVLRQQLYIVGTEPAESTGKVGTTGEDFGKGGIGQKKGGRFYVAVVQAVILFRSGTWVMNPLLKKYLEGFQHWAVRQCGGWRVWAPNVNRIEYGYIHPLGRRWKWWVWRRLGRILPAVRTQLHSKF